jgi:hypothetical protein
MGAGGSGTAGSGAAGSAGMSSDCTPLTMSSYSSGNIGKDAICYDVTFNMAGWGVSNLGMRSLTINGAAPPTPPMVPAAMNGHRIFQFGPSVGGANDTSLYTNWNYW